MAFQVVHPRLAAVAATYLLAIRQLSAVLTAEAGATVLAEGDSRLPTCAEEMSVFAACHHR